MKLKFLLFALLSFLAFSDVSDAQTVSRKTATPTFYTTKPTTCNSSLLTDQLIVVQNDGLYQCISNKLVKGSGDSTTNLSSQKTTLAQLKVITDAAPNAPVVYQLDSAQTVSATQTIAKNVVINYETGGKFTYSSGSLTINGQIKAPRINLFSGFTNAQQLKVKGLTDEYYPEWFGAVGDGVTNDFAAFQLMFDSVQLGANGGIGGDVKLGVKTYKINSTLHVDRTVHIRGQGGSNRSGGSKLQFPANTKGIVFDGISTRYETFGGTMTAGSTTLANAPLSFNSEDIGQTIAIYGAATGGGILRTTILEVFSSSSVRVAAPAGSTIVAGDNYQVFKYTPYSSQNSTISNVWLSGGGDAPTHNVTISGNSIIRISNLAGAHGVGFDTFAGYPPGTTFQIGQGAYEIDNLPVVSVTVNLTANSRLVTVPGGGIDGGWEYASVDFAGINHRIREVVSSTQFKLDAAWTGATQSATMGLRKVGFRGVRTDVARPASFTASQIGPEGYDFTESYQVGATIRINRVDYLITATTATPDIWTVVRKDNNAAANFPVGFTADGWITSLGTNRSDLTNIAVRFHTFHGIDAKVQITADHVTVSNFAGNGFNGDSNINTGEQGQEPNLNSSQIIGCTFRENRSHGLYLRGVNANAMRIEGNFFFVNQVWGIYDISQHGNSYSGNQTANNNAAIYTGGPLNNSTFTGEYVESGSGSSILSQKTSWFGGTSSATAFDAEFSQGAIFATSETNKPNVMATSGIATSSRKPSDNGGASTAFTSVQVGQSDPSLPVLMAFGNSHESGGNNSPLNTYFLTYSQEGNPAPYWYALQHGSATRSGLTSFAFSGALSSDGANQFWTPNGLFFGRGANGFLRGKLSTDSTGGTLDVNLKAPTFQVLANGTNAAASGANRGTLRLVGTGTNQVASLTGSGSVTVPTGFIHFYATSVHFARQVLFFLNVNNNGSMTTPAQYIEEIKNQLNGNSTFNAYYTATRSGNTLIVTAQSSAANDSTLLFELKHDPANVPTGIVEVNSTITTPGVAGTGDLVQMSVQDSTGAFVWKTIAFAP